MRIKKYIATTAAEGRKKIKDDLGEEAVILSMRNIIKPPKNDVLIEFVVAIDSEKSQSNAKNIPSKENLTKQTLNQIEQIKRTQNARSGSLSSLAKTAKVAYQANQPEINSYNNDANFNEIKKLLFSIQDELKYKYTGSLNNVFAELFRRLTSAGISENSTLKTIGKISSGMINADLTSSIRAARQILTENLTFGAQLEKKPYCQNVFFIGPTGAGKTTVLVKIAVILKLVSQADVLIVSADTYKVGSVEQLQTFSSIAGLPFKAVYTAEELQELVSCENTRDFILIDTTGRSPYQTEQISQINDFLLSVKNNLVYYVLSATTNSQVALDTFKAYSNLTPKTLILTKIDEVNSIGSIIEVLSDIGLPISYLSTGQQIPDDLEPADKTFMTKIALPKDILL